jgi:hypothetical protein
MQLKHSKILNSTTGNDRKRRKKILEQRSSGSADSEVDTHLSIIIFNHLYELIASKISSLKFSVLSTVYNGTISIISPLGNRLL